MKKRNKRLISLILAMVMMLICFVACGNANSDSNTTTQSTTTSVPDGTPLTADEVLWFDSQYFNGETVNIRNNFLSCSYTKPEEIDFSQLFYNGTPNGESITEAELDELKKESGFAPELDTVKITAEQMNEIFKEHTGIELSQTNKKGLDRFFHLEDYNSYYLNHGDTNYQLVLITKGYKDTNGNIILNYETLNSSIKASGQVTLKDAGNNEYYFVSNTLQ